MEIPIEKTLSLVCLNFNDAIIDSQSSDYCFNDLPLCSSLIVKIKF